MNHVDTQYIQLAKDILQNGIFRDDRTGTGRISLFGKQMRFDLTKSFPLLTTKKVPFRLVVEELLWFLSGDTNVKTLIDKNVHIWNQDAYRFYKQKAQKENIPVLSYEEYIEKIKTDKLFSIKYGDLGPIYGKQWRSWTTNEYEIDEHTDYLKEKTIDQIQKVIYEIKHNPSSTRLIVSSWNVSDLDKMALPPCHTMFQFYVSNGYLHCQLFQRSADLFLGVPFNIASYSLLLLLIAEECNLKAGEFIHTFGDVHIYRNHVDAIKEQISREPKELPTLQFNKKPSIFDYTYEDFQLINYNPHPPIKGVLSVGL
ncbi:MAG: thymidylate synthase [Ignavibacterium sp.]|nr:thymidylate synthase [Ignavibacterium sp.]